MGGGVSVGAQASVQTGSLNDVLASTEKDGVASMSVATPIASGSMSWATEKTNTPGNTTITGGGLGTPGLGAFLNFSWGGHSIGPAFNNNKPSKPSGNQATCTQGECEKK